MRSTLTDASDYERYCGLDEQADAEREARAEQRAEDRMEEARESGEFDLWFCAKNELEEIRNG